MDAYTGTRGPFNGSPGVASAPAGNQAFTVTGDNAVLANLALSNYKTLIRQKSEDSYTGKTNVTMRNIVASNVYRGWDTVEGQETYNAVMRNVRIIGFERAFARWFSVKGGVIEDCIGVGAQVGESFAIGVHLEGQCENIVVRRCEMRDIYGIQSGGSSYTQGDGFADEGGQTGIVYENCRAIGCGDGGFDLKAKPTLRGQIYAEDCGRGLRWHRGGDASQAVVTVNRMRGRGIWMNGQTSQYPELPVLVIGKLVAMQPEGASSLLRFENGPCDLTINDYDIYKEWRGIKLQENGASGLGGASYPNGGRVQQADGTWISYPGAPPVDSEGRIL